MYSHVDAVGQFDDVLSSISDFLSSGVGQTLTNLGLSVAKTEITGALAPNPSSGGAPVTRTGTATSLPATVTLPPATVASASTVDPNTLITIFAIGAAAIVIVAMMRR